MTYIIQIRNVYTLMEWSRFAEFTSYHEAMWALSDCFLGQCRLIESEGEVVADNRNEVIKVHEIDREILRHGL